MAIWLNDALVDDAHAQVSVFDHGLTVGDGVFETVKVVRGVPFALTRHLDRLAMSARGLGLPEPDPALVRRAVAAVLADRSLGELARLRITLTGGPSPMGSDRGDAGPTLVVVAGPMRPWPPTAAVATVPWTRNEHGALAGLKTTSYGENVIALAFAKARGAGEAIFANTAGQLCEGTGSNVFLVRAGRITTPTLRSGCLAGVTRALVLEWCGAEESDVPLSSIFDADEVFLTSTTRDVQPVARVDDRVLPSTPGPVTRKVMDVFADRAGTS